MGAREVLYIIRRYGRLTPKEIKEIYPKHFNYGCSTVSKAITNLIKQKDIVKFFNFNKNVYEYENCSEEIYRELNLNGPAKSICCNKNIERRK